MERADKLRQAAVWIFAATGTVSVYFLGPTGLAQILAENGWIYALDYPPNSTVDKILLTLIIGLLVSLYYQCRSLYPRVYISKIQTETAQINFGKWWGVEIKLRGHTHDCSAILNIAPDYDKHVTIPIPLRSKRHWEQATLPDDDPVSPVTWILTPGVPTFLPLLVIENIAAMAADGASITGPDQMAGMHAFPSQRSFLSRGKYLVTLYIDYGSHKSAKRKFRIVFDGSDIYELSRKEWSKLGDESLFVEGS